MSTAGNVLFIQFLSDVISSFNFACLYPSVRAKGGCVIKTPGRPLVAKEGRAARGGQGARLCSWENLNPFSHDLCHSLWLWVGSGGTACGHRWQEHGWQGSCLGPALIPVRPEF